MEDKKKVTLTDPDEGTHKQRVKAFTFDYAYWMDTEQSTVYEDLGKPILEKALDGYNGTIFAYGQTGAGKSFSMSGNGDGIIPCLNKELFERIASAPEGHQFLITASYVEIYNEVVRDLLNPTENGLQIRQHPKLGIYVEGLAEIVVKNHTELESLMKQGEKVRSVGSTQMNATSSRSHSIFTVKVEQKKDLEVTGDAGTRGEATELTMHAKVNLVDLAGSERQKSTGASGARLKEGAAINTSLSALGKIISMLADPKKNKGHIPYRDSKLTRLLQESLGGNTLTIMLAAISPADVNFDETLSTLRYADSAKRIQNKAVKNEDDNARMIRELREEIERLRNQLQSDQGGGGAGAGPSTGAGAGGGGAEYLEKMKEMERELELAKRQSWEEKERLSREMEVERRKNLKSAGMLEWVMENLRMEAEKLGEQLQELQTNRDALLTTYHKVIDQNDALKKALSKEVKIYTQLEAQGGAEDPEALASLERIDQLKGDLRKGNEEYSRVKKELKQIAEKQKALKRDVRAQNLFFSEESEIREAMRAEERARVEEELEKEKARLREEMEADMAKLTKGGEDHVQGVDARELRSKVLELTFQKKVADAQVEKLKKQVQELQLVQDLHDDSVEQELERQMLQHFLVFRQYRKVHEEEKRRIEEHYKRLLGDAVQDCIFLSARNQELEAMLRDARLI